MGLFIDKTQKHLVGIRTITLSMGVLYAIALGLIPIGNIWVTCGFGFFAGLFNVPILPASYSYVSKLTPIAPAVVNGLMMSASLIYSFLASLLVIWLLGYGQLYGIGFIALTVWLAVLCVMLIKETDGITKQAQKSE